MKKIVKNAPVFLALGAIVVGLLIFVMMGN